LGQAGILFAVTSGRPPRGMSMLIEPLHLTTPISAFNGGLIVAPDMTVIEQKEIAEGLVAPTLRLMSDAGLGTWLYRGADWYVLDAAAPHVAREAWTVKFEPTVVADFDGLHRGVAKIVGVSDDHDAVDRATHAATAQLGDKVTAAQSQPYYLDVTHPDANKGNVVKYLSRRYDIATSQIATIGDMYNDLSMFAVSGLSVAMGDSDDEVKAAALEVTTSNEEEGFANAVTNFILPS
jgi:Cof subfamily protein (haloacid dehalogenase superfamily)